MATVIIGCKIPNGLIMEVNGTKVQILGSHKAGVIGGYGRTSVDGDFAETWFKLHAGHPAVVKGIIFKADTPKAAEDVAKQTATVRSGLEGLDPENPEIGMTKATTS